MDKKSLDLVKVNITQAENKLLVLRKDITLAERAGIDVADRKKLLENLEMQVRLLKTVYYTAEATE